MDESNNTEIYLLIQIPNCLTVIFVFVDSFSPETQQPFLHSVDCMTSSAFQHSHRRSANLNTDHNSFSSTEVSTWSIVKNLIDLLTALYLSTDA